MSIFLPPHLKIILQLNQFPDSDDEDVYSSGDTPTDPVSQTSDPLSVPRVLCGALLLPSISSIVGHAFFDSVQNNLHRTLLGGLAFIAFKGALKIYFKQKQYKRKKQRKILDYTEENVRQFSARNPTVGGTGGRSNNLADLHWPDAS